MGGLKLSQTFKSRKTKMPLESATYISDLDSANPAATDLLSQGDDHIRLIKAVLKATFPNLNGAVTATDEVLNSVAASITAASIPTGTIVLWYGQSTNVPSGWGICNGTLYPKADLSGNIQSPDLRDRVVIGAGTVAPENTNHGATTASATTASGGAHTHTLSGDGGHTHNPTVAGHALTISEMPAHTHTFGAGSSGSAVEDGQGGTSHSYTTSSTGGGASHTHGISFPGTDGTHTHTMSSDGAHTHGVTVSTYQPAHALHYILKL